MTTATVNHTGRISLPAAVRQAMQLTAGDRVRFVQIESDQFLLMAINRDVTELKGMFGPATTPCVDQSHEVHDRHGVFASALIPQPIDQLCATFGT